MIEEQVGATAATARPDVQYVWGQQYVDDLVVRYRDADASGSSGSPSLEEELYSLADANFNVTAVTENDGDVVERFTYTPYGVSTALDPDFTSYTGSDYNWKYRYTTRELDPLTGLQLNRERWYTNLLGRWMNRDPIGYSGSKWNLYEYVSSRPIIGTDPGGTNIYLKTGNNSGNPVNDTIHQSVCVDIWDDCGRKKVDITCFSFGQSGWMVRIGARLRWLGWSSYTLGGFVMKGVIYETGDVGAVVKTKVTTPKQDRAWLKWMRSVRVGTTDVYSVGRHNCRTYSQWEYADAP